MPKLSAIACLALVLAGCPAPPPPPAHPTPPPAPRPAGAAAAFHELEHGAPPARPAPKPAAAPAAAAVGAPVPAETPKRPTVKFGQPVWQHARARAVGGLQDAPARICQRAVEEARTAAAREVALAAGVVIHVVDIDVQQLRGRDTKSLFESLSEIATAAKLLDERRVRTTPAVADGMQSCTAEGDFMVVALSPLRQCKLETALWRQDRGGPSGTKAAPRATFTNFREGEPVTIELLLSRPAGDTRPAAVFLFSIDDRGRIYPVLPNQEFPKLGANPGQRLLVPTAEHRTAGIVIQPQLPRGYDESVEGFLALALPGPVRLQDLAVAEGGDPRIAVGRLYRAALRTVKDPSELCWDYALYRILGK
jgi:hypothetical protein